MSGKSFVINGIPSGSHVEEQSYDIESVENFGKSKQRALKKM